jgi:hypothetical protein
MMFCTTNHSFVRQSAIHFFVVKLVCEIWDIGSREFAEQLGTIGVPGDYVRGLPKGTPEGRLQGDVGRHRFRFLLVSITFSRR